MTTIPGLGGAVLDLGRLSKELWCFLGPQLDIEPPTRESKLQGETSATASNMEKTLSE